MKSLKQVFSAALLLLLSIQLLGCSQSAASTNSQTGEKQIKLILNHDGSPDHPYHLGSKRFAELAKQYSGGTIEIEVFPSSQIASGTKAVEFVQLDTLDISLCASTSLVNFVPEIGVIDMPFLFASKDEVFQILDGPVGAELEEAAKQSGFLILGWCDNGFKCVSNSVHPIESKEDFAGLKIRVPETETFIKMYEDLNATPTAMAVGEVYTAIQTGVVVGQDNTVANFVKNKYYEVQDYLTISNHIYTAEPFVMNLDKFNSLPPRQQEALMKAAKEACIYQREISLQADEENMNVITEKGVHVSYLAQESLPAIRSSVENVYKSNNGIYLDWIDRINKQLNK